MLFPSKNMLSISPPVEYYGIRVKSGEEKK